MNQGQSPRPVPRVTKAKPAWMQEESRWQGKQEPAQRPWEAEEPRPAPPPVQHEQTRRVRSGPEVIATNTAVRLTCTLCAMMGLLGVFMCWAEKESRAIRHFAVQSAGITAAHGLTALLLVLVSTILSGVPYLGFMVNLMGWLLYMVAVVLMVIVRVRMMKHAWRGIAFHTPMIGRYLEKYE